MAIPDTEGTAQPQHSSENAAVLGAMFEAAYRAAAEARGWNVCSFTKGDKTARTWCAEPHWSVAAEALQAMLEHVGFYDGMTTFCVTEGKADWYRRHGVQMEPVYRARPTDG